MDQAYFKVWMPKQVSEGFGAQIARLIGYSKPQTVDPFVLLDVFKATQPSGFPDHPHRGFEMLTYCLSGEIWCEDSLGNSVVLRPGDAACLNAGKGVLHAMVPATMTCEGVQIWVNVPGRCKLQNPCFVAAKREQLPKISGENWEMRLISGEIESLTSPIQTTAPTIILDIELSHGATLNLPPFDGHSLVFFTLTGSVTISGTVLSQGIAAELRSMPTALPIAGSRETKSRLLVFAGKSLGESIVRNGPFVMPSRSEVIRAAKDCAESTNGFEACEAWRSQAASQVCSL